MPNISINYYGYFTPFGGYGIANLQWITHLSRLGIEVFAHPKFTYKPGQPEWEEYTQEQRELLTKPFVKQRIGIVESTPFDFGVNQSALRIANTMCETSKLGKPWVDACNRMDRIIVPNGWNKFVFEESGVSVPIHVIHHGIDVDFWKKPVKKNSDIFTFGTVGYLNERKGVFDLIRAFASEFAPDEPVRLVLKSSNPAFGYYNRFTDPRISTDATLVSRERLREIYSTFDCFVFPSRSEGVGYPPREAMAMGIPCIIGNYSGLADIAWQNMCYPLDPISFEEGVNPQNIEQPGEWAKYDIGELMKLMRHVYENQKEAKARAVVGAAYLRRTYSWEKCAKDMVQLLETL